MSQYPQEYGTYDPALYQAQQWQGIVEVLMGVAMIVALGAWAFSLARKALTGQDVEFPL